MTFEHIEFEIEEGIARLTLNRPDALNALSRPLLAELTAAVEATDASAEARVLVLRGQGRAFCSGADLSGGSSPAGSPGFDAGEVLEQYYNPLMKRLFDFRLPIVSAVQGPVVGAGCMLALVADIVIAARSAYFLQAFVNIGLVPDAGSSWWLPRLVGPGRALSMMLLGERIVAEDAAAWGMVYKAVDDADLEEATQAIAGRFAAGPTIAYGLIRRAAREALSTGFANALDRERADQRSAGNSADFLEGVSAFREKRKASFKGA